MPLIAVVPSKKADYELEDSIGRNLRESLPVARIIYTKEDNIFDSFAVTSVKWQEKYRYTPYEKDIFLFCHDDIEIITNKTFNNQFLELLLNDPKIGFMGLAGATQFGANAVWWDNKGHLKGIVYHRGNEGFFPTVFGMNCPPHSPVVVCDGIFLLATYNTLSKLDLQKPESFSGDWDFYDIYYTFQAHILNLRNYVIPIGVIHQSLGEPREGWKTNRVAFVEKYKHHLPNFV